jgi:hypothetical protein
MVGTPEAYTEKGARMPIEYVVLNQGTLVLELWTGTVSHAELLAHEQRHLSDSSIAHGASVLADATHASFETTPEEIHQLIDLYRRHGEKMRVGKCALLVNEAAYDRARLYERQATDLGVRVILVNTLGIACTWLGVDLLTVLEELKKLRARSSFVRA